MLIATAVITLSIQVAAPAKVAAIDVKGEPTQLSWSPDGSQLAIQTGERDKAGMMKNPRFYVLSSADGKLAAAQAPPEWADTYWAWKSNQHAPWSPSLAIDITSDRKTVSATSAPMGGSLAKGGGADPSSGTTMEDAVSAKTQSQTLNVATLTLMGETVGYFEGVQFMPGYTFGWAPKDIAAIAYVNASGRLAVMDKDKNKQQVDGTKNVILPAWSLDGARLAFLEKAGKKYELYIAAVTR
jgi:hypothetical protein